MIKLSDCKNMYNVETLDLTEDRIQEALEVFRNGGWDEDCLKSVKAEMMAFFKGDIAGYIRAHFIMAVVNDSIIGVAAWAPSMCSFSVYELSWATVLPTWRHRGINIQMLQERLQKIRAHHGTGLFEVLVYTWDNQMYANAGFSPMLSRDKYSGDDPRKQVLRAEFGAEVAESVSCR